MPIIDKPNEKIAYEATILDQREQRAQFLRQDRSWLTLAGLFWLTSGANSFGSAISNDLILPAHSAAAQAGVFHFDGKRTVLQTAAGVTITVDGEPITTKELRPDSTGTPDFVVMGDLIMVVIQRGTRYAIRLWDKTNPTRQSFTDLLWYPINPLYRIEARFVAHEPARVIPITNILGDIEEALNPGYVTFTWAGKAYQLEAETSGDGLFFNFTDQTNGDATYGAGRFLLTAQPENGSVIMDFNLATNPYCAYTPYAVCPLPMAQNRLPMRVEAGEKNYHA